MNCRDYLQHDGLGLAALVRRGDVTASELLETAVACMEVVQPKVNALAHLTTGLAERQIAAGLPDGPFTGLPFLIKDAGGALGGAPMTSGSALFRDHIAPTDTPLIARHKAAGLVIFGKTNTPELSLSFTTEPLAQGVTRNPCNLQHSAGGSSGGSAAAVAAGIVPLAHASDGAGSIRVPAAHCGLFGLKPTRLRVSAGLDNPDPLMGMSGLHGVSRSVRDSAALLDATAGALPGDPYAAPPQARPYLAETMRDPAPLIIGLSVTAPLGTPVDADCVAAAETAAALLESLGHRVEWRAADEDADAIKSAWEVITLTSVLASVRGYATRAGIADYTSLLEPVNAAWIARGAGLTALDHAEAIAALRRAGEAMGRAFRHCDILLTPATAAPPPLLGVLAGQGAADTGFYDRFWAHSPFTALYNATGCPAASIPFGQTASGLPLGIQVGAPLGEEGRIFALAAQIERARPWHYDTPFRLLTQATGVDALASSTSMH
ncbi:amidase [Acidisoma cellulosilytica]|uniref:Amidase n=1 Tax=Acidisoma cellulosilyticum TaxID=2802395 RepID=A0A963Z2A3_9PROT|nr:amidase [Acidisoma cellulosilyticum]MCB8881419.1 amidase [Acidisoma cellulosilyticum]